MQKESAVLHALGSTTTEPLEPESIHGDTKRTLGDPTQPHKAPDLQKQPVLRHLPTDEEGLDRSDPLWNQLKVAPHGHQAAEMPGPG